MLRLTNGNQVIVLRRSEDILYWLGDAEGSEVNLANGDSVVVDQTPDQIIEQINGSLGLPKLEKHNDY